MDQKVSTKKLFQLPLISKTSCLSTVLYMDNIPTWIAVVSSVGLGLLVAVLTQLCIVPMQKRKIANKMKNNRQPVKFIFDDSVGKSKSKVVFQYFTNFNISSFLFFNSIPDPMIRIFTFWKSKEKSSTNFVGK